MLRSSVVRSVTDATTASWPAIAPASASLSLTSTRTKLGAGERVGRRGVAREGGDLVPAAKRLFGDGSSEPARRPDDCDLHVPPLS